jgi:regulatory protein YycH of two-component signal transduction system YycFG
VSISFSPRAQLSDEEMTAVVVAIEMLTTRGGVVDDVVDATPVWRFSGRWFEPSRRLA